MDDRVARDEGTAYEMPPPRIKDELVRVGRGTPMGELLRRYWHPVGLVGDATNTPKKVRALGEDLVLFRDGAGRAGLLHARCRHRGTTLYYGKVEPASHGRARQKITLQQGIPTDTAKKIVAEIKAKKLKVLAAIQGDSVRVSGKNRDDLQTVIAALKALDLDVPLNFTNYRSQ